MNFQCVSSFKHALINVYSHLYTQQSVIVKFVRLCSVLSDIQSLIGKEGKIANISDANNQSVSFRAAVAVSKSVEVNMCNWVSSCMQRN